MLCFNVIFYLECLTVQGQTLDDLQRLRNSIPGVSCESGSTDQVLESHIGPHDKQEYSEHGISEDTGGLPDVDMLNESSVKVFHTEADNIEVKVEKDIDYDENSITEGSMEKADRVTVTLSEASPFSSTSQMVTNIPGVKAPSVGDKDIKNSEYSILMSSLAKAVMSERNTFHPPHTDRTNQDITTLATAGTASSETFKMGIRCQLCEKYFQNQIELEIHSTFGKCKWVCKDCKKVFVYNKAKHKGFSYKRFQKSLEQHKKECNCICKLCGYFSDERANLVRHMESRHSTAKPFACDICFFTFKSETFMYAHKINKHTGEGGIYSCPVCQQQYPILHSLNAHFKSSHLDPKRDKKACNVCGKILDVYTMKRHEDSHKTKTVKCDKCPAVFKTDRDLKSHQRRHDKDYRYCCETCGKGFYSITPLVNHRRIHTGEKPFSCSLCQYSCNVKVNLDKHMKIHEKRSSSDPK